MVRQITELEQALSTVSITEFEQISGKHYRENTEAENLDMLGFSIGFNQYKKELLQRAGDTTFVMSGDDYAANIEAFGFREVYSEQFMADFCRKTLSDILKVFWHDAGLLLYFDTFHSIRNSAKMWYNWLPLENLDSSTRFSCTSSGCFARTTDDERIWVGDHDAREALRTNVRRLRECGTLLNPWREQPHCLWVTHWGEKLSDAKAFDEATRKRLDCLPEEIQRAILHRVPSIGECP